MAYIKELKSGKLYGEFDSVYDVFHTIKERNWVPRNGKSSDDRGRGDFHTFGSLAEANDIFLNHPEKIRQFSANDSKLANLESPGKEVIYDVTGDFLDIGRYLEGIPEVFGNAVLGNPKSVFCTINVLNSAVSYTTPQYMLLKQKRILRLVDWLESQDIRCQIALTEDSSVSYSSIIVKEFGDHFDLNQLAVGMHPDFFRRTMFLMMEQSKTWSYGYGSSMDYDNRMAAYKPKPEDGLYCYVGGYIPLSEPKLNEAFDRIETQIQEMIDRGETFIDGGLVIKGDNGW